MRLTRADATALIGTVACVCLGLEAVGSTRRGSHTAFQAVEYRDGHTRPRALAYDPTDGLLYVALSTADEVAVVDPRPPRPRLTARISACRFPAALAAAPGGGVLAACRFDAGLRRIRRAADGRFDV